MRQLKFLHTLWHWRVWVWVYGLPSNLNTLYALPCLSYLVRLADYIISLQIDTYHPVIGLIVIGLLAFQPILGLVHHYMFRTYDRKTFWTASHVWVGRLVITLGIINGGLGMRLSKLERPSEIAYGVLAGTVWVVWLGVILWSTFSPSRTTRARDTGEKLERSAEGSEDGFRRDSPGTTA